MDCAGLPLSEFVRWFVARTGESVIYSAGLADRPCHGSFRAVTARDLLYAVARGTSCGLTRVGTVWVFGEGSGSDKDTLVGSWLGEPGDFDRAIVGLLGVEGKAALSRCGLYFISDTPQALVRMERVLSEVRSVSSRSCVLRVVLVRGSREWDILLGARERSVGSLIVPTLLNVNPVWAGAFRLDWEHTLSGSAGDGRREVSFAVVPGVESRYHEGEEWGVARRTVTDSGTSSIAGYEKVEIGFTLVSRLRPFKGGYGVDLDIKDTQLVDVVDSFPRTRGVGYVFSSVVAVGSPRLLGTIVSRERVRRWFLLGWGDTYIRREWLVWAVVDEVSPEVSPVAPVQVPAVKGGADEVFP